ncbi:hypothetical protein QZH41_005854 [Actinostola sp. cb2023]|nr:hypothetical protein QZH41_005854 [Actinostola sp. cb2023]
MKDELAKGKVNDVTKRNAQRDRRYLWMNTIIPYEIDGSLSGFWHEQSRPDRDKYVEIFWENIQQDKQYNFDRSLSSIVDTLGVDYDYNSIVHYKIGAFSKSHKYTITAINDPQNSKNIGPGESLSPLDVVKINSLYSCPSSCSSVTSLGVENAGSLPSQNFQASSHSSLYPPSQGRLNSYSAWCEALSGSANQYLQIDLGAVKHLCAVETQGSGIFGDWVTTYSIHYSKDGVTWNQIQTNGIEKMVTGIAGLRGVLVPQAVVWVERSERESVTILHLVMAETIAKEMTQQLLNVGNGFVEWDTTFTLRVPMYQQDQELYFGAPYSQLVFEGVRGTAYPSDIAIDDVKVLWGPCNSPSDVNPEPNTKPSSNTSK